MLGSVVAALDGIRAELGEAEVIGHAYGVVDRLSMDIYHELLRCNAQKGLSSVLLRCFNQTKSIRYSIARI